MKNILASLNCSFLVAILLGAVMFTSCSKVNVQKLLEEGKAAFYKADYVEAKNAFVKCADEGNSQGQFWLAFTTIRTGGHYSDTDTLAMAKEEVDKYIYDLYKKSADQNDGDGYYGLYTCYMQGINVVKDETKAAEYLDKAVELNSAEAKADRGNQLVQKGGAENIQKGIVMIKESAEVCPTGKAVLGACYMDGTGVEADVNKGLELLKGAAKQNSLWANTVLARIYYFGIKKIPANPEKAFEYALKGMNDGVIHYILSQCYYNGKGTKKDVARAAYQAQRSAECGYVLGQSWWAAFCASGYGTQAEAFDWYMKAANQGDRFSICAVGEYLLKGTAGKTDYAKAKKYLQKAASMGSTEAQELLQTYAWALSDY